jgi:hypothetical protein
MISNIPYSSGFITSLPLIPQRQQKYITILRAHLNKTLTNTSKVYKMDYRSDEEKEYEEFFKPKYLFNLSEFHMTFIRIYVYMVITLHFISVYFEKH